MFVSKALSFSRPNVLNKFPLEPGVAEITPTSPQPVDYFFLGLPSYQPITPEAPLLFVFSDRFLLKNRMSVDFGAIGDSGGVAAGYIPEIPASHASDMRMSVENFFQLVSAIQSLSIEEQYDLMTRKPTRRFLSSVEKFCSPIVADALRESKRQDLWAIEFALRSNFSIHLEEVLNVFIPNTYKYHKFISQMVRKIGPRAIFYNPKFPVVHYAYQEAYVRNWLLRKSVDRGVSNASKANRS